MGPLPNVGVGQFQDEFVDEESRIFDIFAWKSPFEYCSQTCMPDCDLFPIHLGRRLELCRSQLSRGGREEASFVKVEHVLDGPALDKGGDVGGELGCG
jgi:hypothetical protein